MKEQTNAITSQAYKGQNQSFLQQDKADKGYKSNKWVTFLQAREIGKTIRKGEHGTRIVKFIGYQDKDKNGELCDHVGRKVYTVFNLDQCDDIDKPEKGKVYALTGKTGDKCIPNGNSWTESVVTVGKNDYK